MTVHPVCVLVTEGMTHPFDLPAGSVAIRIWLTPSSASTTLRISSRRTSSSTDQLNPATKTVLETFSAISSGVGSDLATAAGVSVLSAVEAVASSDDETAGISSVGSSVAACWSI